MGLSRRHRPITGSRRPYEVPQDPGPASVRAGRAPPRIAGAATPAGSFRQSGNRHRLLKLGSVTGRSLTLVISIMCFLACLTAGAVYMMNQSATAWLRNMSNEITVQIEPLPNADVEQTVREVTSFLTPAARNFDRQCARHGRYREAAGALAGQRRGPGRSAGFLRLIAIEIDGSSPPDLARLGAQLKEQFPNATLDDHRKWRQQINTVTRVVCARWLGDFDAGCCGDELRLLSPRPAVPWRLIETSLRC